MNAWVPVRFPFFAAAAIIVKSRESFETAGWRGRRVKTIDEREPLTIPV